MEELLSNMIIENKVFLFKELPWSMIGIWFIYSSLVTFSKSIRDTISNYLIIQTIPTVFVTLGLFGTFSGIVFGLVDFNTSPKEISKTIPKLLDGLKLAMFSSILGIFLSLVFSKIIRINRSS